eukprot:8940917-Pyramimonas_sp.AAC.1
MRLNKHPLRVWAPRVGAVPPRLLATRRISLWNGVEVVPGVCYNYRWRCKIPQDHRQTLAAIHVAGDKGRENKQADDMSKRHRDISQIHRAGHVREAERFIACAPLVFKPLAAA